MPHLRTATKFLTPQAQDYRAAGAGPHGIALAPPTYELDIVDRAATDEGPLQLRPAPVHAPVQRQAPVTRPNRTGLPDRLKAGIESLSGYDLSDVRVHYHSSKPAQLHALAYTQGTDIYVAPGQAKHLPHEAWHVVQQKQGRVQPTFQLKGEKVNDEEGLEREAEVMGTQAFQMRRPDDTATVADAEAVMAVQTGRAAGAASQVQRVARRVSEEKGRLNCLSTIQRYVFINGSKHPNNARSQKGCRTQEAKDFLGDDVVRDYKDWQEFQAHAAGQTDYLGNLGVGVPPEYQGTWLRFNKTGLNLLGESHEKVRLEHSLAAVNALKNLNFIYEGFSNDSLGTESENLQAAIEAEHRVRAEAFGIAYTLAMGQQHGAESVYPKIGYGMMLLADHLKQKSFDALRSAYTGEPIKRYLQLAWGLSADAAKQLNQADSQSTSQSKQKSKQSQVTLPNYKIAMGTSHKKHAPLIGPLIKKLHEMKDGNILAVIEKHLGQDKHKWAALQEYADEMSKALQEMSRQNEALLAMPQSKQGTATEVFTQWRDINLQNAVNQAYRNKLRYAGMGQNHVVRYIQKYLQNHPKPNIHPYDMAKKDIDTFRDKTEDLKKKV